MARKISTFHEQTQRLIEGETLKRVDVIKNKETIEKELKIIKQNCSILLKQFKEVY